jgi:hypothetical protein
MFQISFMYPTSLGCSSIQVSLWQERTVNGRRQPIITFATVTDRQEDNLAPKRNNPMAGRACIGLK